MISGFLRPSAGAVEVLGEPSWRNTEIFRRVGLVPEREAIYPFLGARDFALASARLHGLSDPHEAARRAVALVELKDAQTGRWAATRRACASARRSPPRSSTTRTC